jgi:hypothetical protein
MMPTEDREVKNRLSEVDEVVTEKMTEDGGDFEAIKRGIESKRKNKEEKTGGEVEDSDNGVKTGDNTPNPT